ncbi:MAG: TldD/PmbA family protein [bacterium]
MNNSKKLELARWVVAEAKKVGADDVAVDVYNSRDIEISCREAKLENLQESTQSALDLSIYADQRYTNHSTNDLRRETLSRFIAEAVAMTRYLSQDEYRALPDPKLYEGRKDIDLGLADPEYDSVTSDQRVKIAMQLEEAARSHSDKIISCTSGFADSYSESVKVHSNGFEGTRHVTSYACGVEVTVDDGQGGRPEDWDWRTVRFSRDIPQPDVLARSAVNRTLAKIGQEQLPSGVYDMIVENRSGGRLLGALQAPMRASALQQKSSFLDGKLGEQIASDKLTWIDDPFIKSGMGSRLYDGEGIATRRRVIVDKGVFKQFYIDNYYGRKLDMQPNSGATTNIVFELGERSLDEMVAGMERGILIRTFIGGNNNSTTGDFSYGVMGHYVEKGKLIRPISEMNISGNSLELWKRLVEMGNDPYTYSAWQTPSMYFQDVEFSGA